MFGRTPKLPPNHCDQKQKKWQSRENINSSYPSVRAKTPNLQNAVNNQGTKRDQNTQWKKWANVKKRHFIENTCKLLLNTWVDIQCHLY